jgi:hypothetical protein
MLKTLFVATALAGATFAGSALTQEPPTQTKQETENQKFETGAGAVTGAAVGAAASVPEPAKQYVIANPVEPVVIEERVVVGTAIPETVVIHQIPDSPEFGYVYVDKGPVVVRKDSREVVYIDG